MGQVAQKLEPGDEVEFIDDDCFAMTKSETSLYKVRGKVVSVSGEQVKWAPHDPANYPANGNPWSSGAEQLKLLPKVDLSKLPHKCPGCNSPAYVGFLDIDCSASCR